MKLKIYKSMCLAVTLCFTASILVAQVFPSSIEPEFGAKEVRLTPSEIEAQILFIGGETMVQTTATYGNPAGEAPAKQWHDFIGFTPDPDEPGAGWISVNHERIEANDNIGDGGGMTVFKVRRSGDSLAIVSQTLDDGRTGEYFNVDFVNTVGETGMNCGGIVSDFDGRIWTAEEWFRTSNANINYHDTGVRDTTDFTLNTPEFPEYDGQTIAKYENMNWMVEIDPKQAVAIRKQYNWGRQPFEGGVVLPDNKTVFLGPDNTPGYFGKFEADTPGDFTTGSLYVYSANRDEKWVEIDNSSLDNMLNHFEVASDAGATMFNRIEWVTYDAATNAVYFTATGRDNPGSRLAAAEALGATVGEHIQIRSVKQGLGVHGWSTDDYVDYYGRIMKYDLETEEISVFMEGGPDIADANVSICDYPEIHLSNPDGLSTYVNPNGKSYLIIQEDLNGDTYGRTPTGTFGNFGRLRTCEMFALDLSIEEPTFEDLVRIAIIPYGAEITGARQTTDGKTLLVNSQHPNEDNPYPYNNSLTIAINGIDKVLDGIVSNTDDDDTKLSDSGDVSGFKVFPNPTTRTVTFEEAMDVAIYDNTGNRIRVYRDRKSIDVSDLPAGVYYLNNAEGKTAKLIVQ
jgi:secreted PhoX family phosphatase